jgi:hypothetical protein
MDCTIAGPSIRPFCAAIGCLSRIGKELYVDFHPLDGLSLRGLNDAKSVFGNFHYESSFFTTCTTVRRNPSTSAGRARKRKHGSDSDGDNNNHNLDDDDERWTARIAMKALAAVVRPRRDVLSLRVRTTGDHLSFEFQLEKAADPPSHGSVLVRVVHKVGYYVANGVTAIASTDGASELVAKPTVLTTMLEPLSRSMEVALIVNDAHRMICSVTFSHDDLPDDATTSLAQRAASLKTETNLGYDDLVDVTYVGYIGPEHDDDGGQPRHDRRRPPPAKVGIPPPEDVKEQVVLVFTLKEFKSFLQYCTVAHTNQELQVSISFFWGGRPMVVRAAGEHFHAELVMATLDHRLLRSMQGSSVAATTAAATTTTTSFRSRSASGGNESDE